MARDLDSNKSRSRLSWTSPAFVHVLPILAAIPIKLLFQNLMPRHQDSIRLRRSDALAYNCASLSFLW